MGYLRSPRRSLSGLTSRAPGRMVSRGALGAAELQNHLKPVQGLRLVPGRSIVPDWYQAMSGVQGTSLGDDTLDVAKDAAELQWRADMLAGQKALIAAQKVWAEGDHFQKWVQIGVTASIPLFGALWRVLGIGDRLSRTSS